MFNSFKYAFRGLKDALKSEKNLKIHFLASMLVLFVAMFLKFNFLEFSVLILTIFLVIILELINTIVEKLLDIVNPDFSEKVRIIKDISASVVLLGAIASVIVGFFLFLPKL